MSIKYSRDRGRVQPTPPVCKKPPIPQPPSTPLECLAANLYWNGYGWMHEPFNLTGVAILHRTVSLYTHRFVGNLGITHYQATIAVDFQLDYSLAHVEINTWHDGIPNFTALTNFTPAKINPLDSGLVANWTTIPHDTRIELRLLG
jgi:hypothetical protein